VTTDYSAAELMSLIKAANLIVRSKAQRWPCCVSLREGQRCSNVDDQWSAGENSRQGAACD